MRLIIYTAVLACIVLNFLTIIKIDSTKVKDKAILSKSNKECTKVPNLYFIFPRINSCKQPCIVSL